MAAELSQPIWTIYTSVVHFLKTSKSLVVSLAQDFKAVGCQNSAAALTYATMFALVPTMTVVYWLFSFFPAAEGASEQLQNLVFSKFVPEASSDILTYVGTFSEKARSLSGAGAILLLVTAYMMLTNIENTFNTIWGVRKARRGLSSFLLYWAVLTIGPILVLAGLVMNTYLLSLRLVFNEYDPIGFTNLFFQVLPWLMAAAAFSLLFVAVPNCRVPLKYGVIGGCVTALCFELLKAGFGLLVANSSFRSVYGAFAALPLFLLWVNGVWMVVLSGALLVRTLAERRYLLRTDRLSDMSAVLICLGLFYSRAKTGQFVSDFDCYRLGVNVIHWQQLRAKLLKHRWITETSSGRYVLCRDLTCVTLWDLACVVDLKLYELAGRIPNKESQEWIDQYQQIQSRLSRTAQDQFSLTVEDVLSGQHSGIKEFRVKKDETCAENGNKPQYSEQLP